MSAELVTTTKDAHSNNDDDATIVKVIAQYEDFTFSFPSDDVVPLKHATSSFETWDKVVEQDPDNKFIIGSVVHAIRETTLPLKSYANKNGTKADDQLYDRGIFITDLMDESGECYLLLWQKNAYDSFRTFFSLHESIIGTQIVVREPKWNGRYAADGVPILHAETPDSIVAITNKFKPIVDIPIQPPKDYATFRYFRYLKVKIQVSRLQFYNSCNGHCCDKNETDPNMPECFCDQKDPFTGTTMYSTIRFTCPGRDSDAHYIVNDYASYRFTKLFLPNEPSRQDLDQHKKQFREHVKTQVHLVNESDQQWMIEGWYRQDMITLDNKPSSSATLAYQKDSKEVQKAPSIELKLHIVSLTPNDPKYTDSNSEQNLLWKYNTRTTTLHH